MLIRSAIRPLPIPRSKNEINLKIHFQFLFEKTCFDDLSLYKNVRLPIVTTLYPRNSSSRETLYDQDPNMLPYE